MENKGKTYSQKQFAELIGVTPRTLLNWSKKGVLVPYRTIGGKIYYTDDHVELLVEKQKQNMDKGLSE